MYSLAWEYSYNLNDQPFRERLRLVYYSNTRILCVCLCVSVVSENSGTERSSSTLLSPTWRSSHAELSQLVLELTKRLVSKEKPLELSHREIMKPRPSRYMGAILKKFSRLPEKG